jgi:hypothetical protein
MVLARSEQGNQCIVRFGFEQLVVVVLDERSNFGD